MISGDSSSTDILDRLENEDFFLAEPGFVGGFSCGCELSSIFVRLIGEIFLRRMSSLIGWVSDSDALAALDLNG